MYFNDSLVCFSKKLFSALLSVVLLKKYCSENSEKLCCARQIQQQPDLCSGSNNICLARPNGLARQILFSPSHKSCMIIQNGWSSKLHTIEVGTRGLVASSAHQALRGLGFTSHLALKISRALSLVTERCSYAIWLKHHTTKFLLDMNT